jgi:hypothetical protein
MNENIGNYIKINCDFVLCVIWDEDIGNEFVNYGVCIRKYEKIINWTYSIKC